MIFAGNIKKNPDKTISLSGSYKMKLGEEATIDGTWSGVK